MANLSELPHDMLVVISKLLKKLEDFVSFRCVSKSLYAAAKDEYFEGLRLRQRLPYLLLPVRDDDNDDIRELYSLVEGESIVASVKAPKFKGKKCFESLGWLLAVEGDGNMALLDPFSGSEIPLPHQNTFPDYEQYAIEEHMFMQKMVLSARPSETSDFILMVICGNIGELAFWRLGDKAWNKIKPRAGRYADVVYHGNGKFYAIGHPGYVWVFRLAKNDNNVTGGCLVQCRAVVPSYETSHLRTHYPSMKLYILKAVDGSLLIITRKSPKLSEDGSSYITTEFHVYKVNKLKKTWKEIYSLGSMAVFVGHNSTIALDASGFPGGAIRANHIYFTDDDWDFYYFYSPSTKGGGLNMGVYNLETGAIEPFYPGEPMRSKVSTSLWINPPCF